MVQPEPTYGYATGKSEDIIVDQLVRKYGFKNITWPIVLIKNNKIISYLYEKNFKNSINSAIDSRPNSSSNLPSYFIDYCASPRIINPKCSELTLFIDSNFSCSYEYILNSDYSTVDLDYVWKINENKYRGFELTTFYVPFSSKAKAEDLVSKINRRPSWQGPNGAHALRRIVSAANDLNIIYYMVCANTVSKVGTDLMRDGNIYYFKLDEKQIDRLETGYPPIDGVFCTFSDFLAWL